MVDQFCFPSGKLSNAFVELTPFSAPSHAQALYNISKNYPEMYKNCPYGPYENFESFMASFFCGILAQSNGTLAFAIIDKTNGSLAGVTAFMDANPTLRSLTIGTLFIPPQYD